MSKKLTKKDIDDKKEAIKKGKDRYRDKLKDVEIGNHILK